MRRASTSVLGSLLFLTLSGGPATAADLGVAVADSYTVAQDSGATNLPVLENDGTPTGGIPAAPINPSDPAHGTAVVDPSNTITYTPDTGFSGPDSFTYSFLYLDANNQLQTSNTVTVSITVTPAPPGGPAIGVDDSYTVAQDSGSTTLAVGSNDNIPTVAIYDNPSDPPNGTATLANSTPPATIDYRPDPGFSGTDTFTYTFDYLNSTGQVEPSRTVTVTVTVTPTPPGQGIGVDDSYTVAQDSGSTTLAVGSNDNIPTLAIYDNLSDPAHGTATLANAISPATINYAPDPGYSGTDSFTYAFEYLNSTGQLQRSRTVTVTITVTPTGEPPESLVAVNDSYSMEEDSVGVTLEPPPTENDTGTISEAVVDSEPTHGDLTQTSATTFQYTPERGFTGADSFTYHVVGPNDAASNTATVTLTVTPLDEDPGPGPGDGENDDDSDDDDDRNGDGDEDDDESDNDEDIDKDDQGALPDTGGTMTARMLFIAMLSTIGGLFLLAHTRRVHRTG